MRTALDILTNPVVIVALLSLVGAAVIGPAVSSRLARRETESTIRKADIEGLSRIIERAYAEVERLEKKALRAEQQATDAEKRAVSHAAELEKVKQDNAQLRHDLEKVRLDLEWARNELARIHLLLKNSDHTDPEEPPQQED